MPPEAGKPLGVTLVALCAGLYGIVCLPLGCIGLLVSQVPQTGFYFTVLSVIVLSAGVLFLAATYGIWTMQGWGRELMRWICIVSIPLGVVSIFPIWPGQVMTLGNTLLQIVGVVVDVAIVQYLMKPEVIARFQRNNSAQAYRFPGRGEPRL